MVSSSRPHRAMPPADSGSSPRTSVRCSRSSSTARSLDSKTAARTAGSAPRAASPAWDMASSADWLPWYRRRNSSRPESPPASSSRRRYAGTGEPGGRCSMTASASDPAAPGSYKSLVVSSVSMAPNMASTCPSTASRRPSLEPKRWMTSPGETPAAAAICRTVTASGPRSANSRSASSRMTARVVRSSGIELMFSIVNDCLYRVKI